MGKEQQSLPSVLSFKEKLKLKHYVDNELKKYQDEINKQYDDTFEASLLIEERLTKEKNEILRKIKFMRMKKTNLPNFIRKKTEELLNSRKIEEQAQLDYINATIADN